MHHCSPCARNDGFPPVTYAAAAAAAHTAHNLPDVNFKHDCYNFIISQLRFQVAEKPRGEGGAEETVWVGE